jgi:phosphocarrier protein HPr
MNNTPLTRTVTVRNPQGLHARPADLVVRKATSYQSLILIGRDGELVDCKSILSLLTLGAAQGTELLISADGDDAEEALDSIAQLFDAGFDDKNEMKGAEPVADM